MKTRLNFFRTTRNDTAVRYGIIVNDDTVWMHFDPGHNTDISLLWYVFGEMKGDLPEEPEAALRAFLDYEKQINSALTEVIVYLRDLDGILSFPTSSSEKQIGPDITLVARCASYGRMRAREILPYIVEPRDNWRRRIEQLELVAPVAAK